MAEELQNLINRIQQEGVARAEAEAEKILAAARERAAGIVREAERAAGEARAGAERDAETFVERGRRALQQAARDAVLSVEDSLYRILRGVVEQQVGEAMTIEVLQQMLVKVVESYCAQRGDCSRVDLLVGPDDHKRIVEYFLRHFRSAIERGAEIHMTADVGHGFRVLLEDQHLHHDFTRQEIAAALSRMLRPALAEIVRKAVEAPAPANPDIRS